MINEKESYKKNSGSSCVKSLRMTLALETDSPAIKKMLLWMKLVIPNSGDIKASAFTVKVYVDRRMGNDMCWTSHLPCYSISLFDSCVTIDELKSLER